MEQKNARTCHTGKADTPYGAMFYRVYHPLGTGGKKILVCLHGNSVDGTIFEKLVQQLPYYKVIVLDALGHGQSDCPSTEELAREAYSFEGMAIAYFSALSHVLQHQQEQTFTLLGLSKGGHEAIQMCNVSNVKLPISMVKRVDSLIITGTPPLQQDSPPSGDASANDAIMKAAFYESKALSLCGSLQSFSEDDARTFMSGYGFADEESVSKFVTIAKKTDGKARRYMVDNLYFSAKTALRTTWEKDEVGILSALKIPVLIVGGKDDLFVNYDYVSNLDLTGHNKNITLVLIEKEGTCVCIYIQKQNIRRNKLLQDMRSFITMPHCFRI